jgi:cell division control protein 6
MPQQFSTETESNSQGNPTKSLIREAFLTSRSRQIVLHSQFLDDEKLTQSERVAVLQEVFHRNIRLKQLERVAKCLAPAPVLGGMLPPNVLVYGPSGTGKSVSCLHFLSTLRELCAEKGVAFQYFYVDLTTPHTCFGALNELAMALEPSVRRYHKGVALEYMQESVIQALSRMEGLVCILIDEADNVTIDADVFLTFLAKTLPKKVSVHLSYIFLTNRLEWERTLDPRILSVLKKMDVIFEPYDALDLVEILRLRVDKALDSSKVDDAAVRKIAAYASRETGDARKAVELLVKAVKVAEETSGRLSECEVDLAERTLEVDKTEELIGALASQQRLALMACYAGLGQRHGPLSTGNAYEFYQEICRKGGDRPLTQRRFADIIGFLDLYGLVRGRVTSKGRYGKTREVSASLPEDVVQKLLKPGKGGQAVHIL